MNEQLRHEDHMRRALVLAGRGLAIGELPIGALVAVDDEVIAEAHCADKQQRMLAHPELLALIDADRKHPSLRERRRMTLYTTLEPCVMCLGAAMSFCVGTIVFGTNAPADGGVTRLAEISFGAAGYPAYRMPDVVAGVLRAESRSLFQTFVETSRDAALIGFARTILDS